LDVRAVGGSFRDDERERKREGWEERGGRSEEGGARREEEGYICLDVCLSLS
jgi:hypothetical protein